MTCINLMSSGLQKTPPASRDTSVSRLPEHAPVRLYEEV